ncbi:hypothetical protein KO561_19795 [Radiobacillus kanasensis]|uniref:hypothetical protein n=1 Tax=Radiobacillus kanasensis TaxID=2844358 RepID=UPI001E2FEB5E|nr:hypothetical protein [Radiobacillus kanasensis]UFT99380.1 hypothetical protein KO561_19795 [Radiobacillus kanasensis]
MKRKKIIISIISLLILLFALGYLFRPPSDFPSEKELLNQIPEAKTIQDILFLDDKHVYVPFIMNDNSYGMSMWVWKNGWRLVADGDIGAPYIWQIYPDNPDSYRLLYNIHPEDQVSSINFYLLRRRYYSVSFNDVHTYTPGIQKHFTMELSKKSYGMIKIPTDWKEMIIDYMKVSKEDEQPILPSLGGPYIEFAWNTTNQHGEEIQPHKTYVGGFSITGSYIINSLRYMNQEEINLYNE